MFPSLHFAAREGSVEIIKQLLAEGANVKLLTDEGEQAIALASDEGHLEAVKILHEAGGEFEGKEFNWFANI